MQAAMRPCVAIGVAAVTAGTVMGGTLVARGRLHLAVVVGSVADPCEARPHPTGTPGGLYGPRSVRLGIRTPR